MSGIRHSGIGRRELMAGGGALALSAALPVEVRAGGAASPTLDSAVPELAERWRNPPHAAKLAAYWYWMGGAVTKVGITADLTAMRDGGIGRATMFSIGKSGKTPQVSPPADALTPIWWDMVEHAATEADRLGVELAMNMCDGWATASGPWITPELSMQHLVWGEVRVDGGRSIDVALPTGEVRLGYHRDVAVVAVPIAPEWEASSAGGAATIVSDLPLANPAALADPANEAVLIDTGQGGSIDYRFARPFTLRSLTVRTPAAKTGFATGVLRAANSLWIEASDDGVAWRPVGRLDYPGHGWQTDLTTLTHAVPETTARAFRFVHRPEGPFDYDENRDFGQETALRLTGLHLSSMPMIHHLPIKSGAAWGRSRRMDDAVLPPASCVPRAALVDLTHAMDADGRLRWRAPPGRWRILRFGCTTTGKKNAAAGLGEGLECDRFNPEAARLQFESWFGRALDRLGPVGRRVLKTVHVDSWEAHTQNWSPAFPADFARLRGYALLPWLATMAGVPVESMEASEGFLFDLRRTIAELARDNFYAPVAALAHARGCRFSGEPQSPTFLADGLDYARHVDEPMGEFWVDTPRNDKPNDIKDAVSGARIYGNRLAGAESFTQGLMTWREHPYLFKRIGDHVFCEGINHLHLHVWAQQPWPDRAPGMTLNGIGSHFAAQQSWWKPAQGWRDYVVRAQALLQAGNAVADIAYFIGEDIPTRALMPRALVPALPAGFAYDSINRDALLRLATVRDGRITLPGGASYRVLVLPPGGRMTLPLAERIAQLVADGATVIGPRPTRLPGLESGSAGAARLAAIVADLWGSGRIAETTDLAALLGTPAFVAEGADRIEWTHRRGPGWAMFFVFNPSDHAVRFVGRFRSTGAAPELWDADRGTIEAAGAWCEEGGATQVPVALDPGGSAFLLFAGSYPGRPVADLATPAARFRRTGRGIDRIADTGSPIAVPGPWTLRFAERLAQPRTVRLDRLRSWTELEAPELRFYSGVATYATTLHLPPARADRELVLDLGAVANLATVRIDGRQIGYAWRPPFQLVLPAGLGGRVTLEIDVANTWRNRLIGDHGKPEDARVSHVVPMLRKGQPWLPGGEGATLDPAGLLGPVRVLTRTVTRVSGR